MTGRALWATVLALWLVHSPLEAQDEPARPKPEEIELSGKLIRPIKWTPQLELIPAGQMRRFDVQGKLLDGVKEGTFLRVRGVVRSRLHPGSTKDNPSPFPPQWTVWLEVTQLEVLKDPMSVLKPAAAPNDGKPEPQAPAVKTGELPPPPNLDLSDPAVQQAVEAAQQDALQLRSADDALPPLEQVRAAIREGSFQATLAARDPRLRVEIVAREGGTLFSEAAVARGLRWISLHQSADGSWSLQRFHRAADCDCRSVASLDNDVAGTALALLPMLGAGQTHRSGRYQQSISRGLSWLIASQAADGSFPPGRQSHGNMYAHGIATIVLCEAYAMTKDDKLMPPAQAALNYIIYAQSKQGGWRYYPRKDSDTSVTGWQLSALHLGRCAGLSVPAQTMAAATRYLDQAERDGGYAYTPGGPLPNASMTASGLNSRLHLGADWERPGMGESRRLLIEKYLPEAKSPDFYYWYFGSQVFHDAGGEAWAKWNPPVRDALVALQNTKGHQAGSWPPRVSRFGQQGGGLYVQALATCTLQSYYRYLPSTRRIELAEPETPPTK